MATENNNIQNAEELVDKLQFLGIIPGPQQYYTQFFTANAGLVTSMGDLINKIDNDTATQNDYIDVLKDIGAIGVSTVGLTALALGTKLSPWAIGIGLGLATLDYADEHNYDLEEMIDGLNGMLKDAKGLLGGAAWGITDAVSGLFNAAIQARYGSPLTLDLDGDGIETVGIDINHLVLFDNNNDGIKTATGWVSSDDGLLVLDRNANGTIDNGSELFGDNTWVYDSNNQPVTKAANGFDALAQYDTDKNGKIDETDSIYTNLKIWQDYNQDGISQVNELSSLNSHTITSIGLFYEASSIISNSNLYALNGTYQKDNATQTITDVYFIQESFYREFTDIIPLTEAASTLQTSLAKQLQNYTEPLNNINLSQYMIKLDMKTDIIKNNFFICLNNIWFEREAV